MSELRIAEIEERLHEIAEVEKVFEVEKRLLLIERRRLRQQLKQSGRKMQYVVKTEELQPYLVEYMGQYSENNMSMERNTGVSARTISCIKNGITEWTTVVNADLILDFIGLPHVRLTEYPRAGAWSTGPDAHRPPGERH